MIVSKILRQPLFTLVVAACFLLPRLSESCMSCYHPGSLPHKHKQHQSSQAIAAVAAHPNGMRTNSMAVATTAARQALQVCKDKCRMLQHSLSTHQRALRLSASAAIVTGGVIVIARHHMPATVKGRLQRGLWRNQVADNSDGLDGDEPALPDENSDLLEEPQEPPPVTSQAMIATIGVYKNFISPLLPPACRFAPTCSQYGVQAIEKYGPSKGVILTAWRLLRCSPFGGKGYDPPKWPPVSYTYSSY